jgi:hypothetical protein
VVKNVSSVKKEGIAHDNFSYIVFDFKIIFRVKQIWWKNSFYVVLSYIYG